MSIANIIAQTPTHPRIKYQVFSDKESIQIHIITIKSKHIEITPIATYFKRKFTGVFRYFLCSSSNCCFLSKYRLILIYYLFHPVLIKATINSVESLTIMMKNIDNTKKSIELLTSIISMTIEHSLQNYTFSLILTTPSSNFNLESAQSIKTVI